MMQATYLMLLDWQRSDPQRDPNSASSLDEDILKEMIKNGMVTFIGSEDKYRGGAPPEFLPQMLLEEDPVRVFPILKTCDKDQLISSSFVW